ncbi:hypothetical protein [Haloarchaeobius sp. FL176]|uniref:hypothetical protein n=1 Tax=Haloarchaeobius sp. FL176 TaxID=2967129 RepID=UPI002148EB4E|nr:hypothetical protein [Haloarchaeobius sp. FL176]
MKRPSRRRLLAATGAAAASFSLAGCSSNSSDDADDTPTGTAPPTDGTTTEDPNTTQDTGGSGEPVGADQLRHWVPVNGAYEFDVQAAVMYDGDLEAIREYESDFYTGTYDQISQTLLGPALSSIVPPENRRDVVQIATAATVIAETSMGNDELGTALTDAGLSEFRTEGDATLYEGELNGNPTAAAVVEGVVVQSFGSNATTTVETVLGARSGEVGRLVDNSTAVSQVFGAIGDDELTVLTERAEDSPSGDPSLDGATALGYGWEFGSDSAGLTLAVTFGSVDQVGDPSAVASYFGEQDGLSDYENIQSSADGNLVLVTGSIATNEFDLLAAGTPGESGGGGTTAPQVQFAFEFTSDTMTVTHEAGDTIQASNLTLIVGNGQASTQFVDEYEEVTAGDSIPVDISNTDSGSQVALVWSDGQTNSILAQTQVP